MISSCMLHKKNMLLLGNREELSLHDNLLSARTETEKRERPKNQRCEEIPVKGSNSKRGFSEATRIIQVINKWMIETGFSSHKQAQRHLQYCNFRKYSISQIIMRFCKKENLLQCGILKIEIKHKVNKLDLVRKSDLKFINIKLVTYRI